MGRLLAHSFSLAFFLFLADAATAQGYKGSVTAVRPFSVDRLAIGGRVAPQSRVYQSYACSPSEDYPGFTWCKRIQKKKLAGESVQVSTTIIHGADNLVAYVNQTISPAKFRRVDLDKELRRLSERFQSKPQTRELTEQSGSLRGVLATWGEIELQKLGSDEMNVLAGGRSPHSGILVDLLNNFHLSARAQLPVYRVSGGQGFVWLASFDDTGTGSLRFFAMDPSLLRGAPAERPPVARSEEPPRRREPESGDRFSQGTGFFVSGDGFAVTNAHVVENCNAVAIIRPLSDPTSARVVAQDSDSDLALLKSDLKVETSPVIRIGARVGEAISAFGFPHAGVLSTSGNFTAGNISALAGMGDDARFLQISAPVQAGNSGGPVFDQSGNVVGVVVSKLDAMKFASKTNDVPQNVNFAIKAAILANFLDRSGIRYSTVASDRPLQSADLAERAKSLSILILCKQ